MNDSIKYCLDANVLITAWQSTYPPEVFPSLWEQLAAERHQYILIKPIFDEIEPYSGNDKTSLSVQKRQEKYPLRVWLEDSNIQPLSVPESLEGAALEMEEKYDTKPNNVRGASKNDIRLIAYANKSSDNLTIVTLESKQRQRPKYKSNYKIPLICKEQNITCIDPITFFREIRVEL